MPQSSTLPRGRFVAPAVVASHFHIHKGDSVGDFGVGVGYFIPTLSKLVGPEGKVYALEIQRNLLDSVSALCFNKNLENVDVVWCDLEEEGGSKLHDGVLDGGILINTLFQMEKKDVAMAEMVRTIRPGGRFIIIDWSESFGGLGPREEEVIDAKGAIALAEAHGLVFERSFDAGDHHYGLAFQKV